MAKLNEQVEKLLNETKTVVLATCDEAPNAVSLFFKKVEDGKIILFDVFMNKTLENIKKNPKVAVTFGIMTLWKATK